MIHAGYEYSIKIDEIYVYFFIINYYIYNFLLRLRNIIFNISKHIICLLYFIFLNTWFFFIKFFWEILMSKIQHKMIFKKNLKFNWRVMYEYLKFGGLNPCTYLTKIITFLSFKLWISYLLTFRINLQNLTYYIPCMCLWNINFSY